MLDQLTTAAMSLHGNSILVVGLLLLSGIVGGLMAGRIKWLPTITAFMIIGALAGPHALGIISKSMLTNSMFLIDIALGLILYQLGNMLHPKAMLTSRRLMITSALESGMTFIATFALLIGMGLRMEIAAIIGAIAVSSSPAVLVHISAEMHANGIITERAKSLIALNNVFSFIIYSMTLPIIFASKSGTSEISFLMPLYSLGGSAVIGILCSFVAVRIARFLRPEDEHYRFVIVIGSIMTVLGLSITFHTSLLFAPIILGMATRYFENTTHQLSRTEMGPGGDLFFIILFVIAGAKLDFSAILAAGLIPFALVIIRLVGKFSGLFLAAKLTGTSMTQFQATSLTLIPMAGMAIGLVASTNNYLPGLATEISAMVFSMVAIFETIGPFAVMHGLRLAGEIGTDEDPKHQL